MKHFNAGCPPNDKLHVVYQRRKATGLKKGRDVRAELAGYHNSRWQAHNWPYSIVHIQTQSDLGTPRKKRAKADVEPPLVAAVIRPTQSRSCIVHSLLFTADDNIVDLTALLTQTNFIPLFYTVKRWHDSDNSAIRKRWSTAGATMWPERRRRWSQWRLMEGAAKDHNIDTDNVKQVFARWTAAHRNVSGRAQSKGTS